MRASPPGQDATELRAESTERNERRPRLALPKDIKGLERPLARKLRYMVRSFVPPKVKPGEDPVPCLVCQDDLERDQLVVTLPCFHQYHWECLCDFLSMHQGAKKCLHDNILLETLLRDL